MSDIDAVRAQFENVYSQNLWSYGSGPGSAPRNTTSYRLLLEDFMRDNAIRTVTDFGCGDWQFSQFIDWSAVAYTGLDIVQSIVDANVTRFGRPGVDFKRFDSVDDLPGGDLLVSKEVLQHLPDALILEYMQAIRAKYRYALITNGIEPWGGQNVDIPAGACRPLRLEQTPFSLPGAVIHTYYLIADGVYYKNAVYLVMGTTF